MSRPKLVFRFIERTLAVIGLYFLIYHAFFRLTVIGSDSMSPTLVFGDYVLTEKISYLFRSPRRWELIEFLDPEYSSVMKRAAALPGETITIDEDRVIINGIPQTPPDSIRNNKYYGIAWVGGGRSYRCTHGYFLLGDDSKDSLDSRFVGQFDPSRIRGRPFIILWPPARFGFVNP